MDKGNLLVIDDDETILVVLERKLKSCCDQLFTAQDGLEALRVLEKENVHTIVCDIDMPNLSGDKLLEKLRESGNDIPFIFYTAMSEQKFLFLAAKHGALHYIQKPNMKGIEQKVKEALIQGVGKVPK